MKAMSLGAARAIFEQLSDKDYTDEQKLDAIWTVAGMETHNNFRRDDCWKAIKFLLRLIVTRSWIQFTFEYDADLGAEILSCQTPDEDQEILVTDGKYVWIDTFLSNGEEYYLDSNQDFRGLAWMPKPDPKF